MRNRCPYQLESCCLNIPLVKISNLLFKHSLAISNLKHMLLHGHIKSDFELCPCLWNLNVPHSFKMIPTSCKKPLEGHNIGPCKSPSLPIVLVFTEDYHTLVQAGICSTHIRIFPPSYLITNVLCPFNNNDIGKSLKDSNWATIQI